MFYVPVLVLGRCRRPGNGGAQTCLPAAHDVAPATAWYSPASATTIQDTREADDTKAFLRGAASPGWPPKSRDNKAGCTSRGTHDVSHDNQGQAGASGSSGPVSSLVLRRQVNGNGISPTSSIGTESQAISQRFPFRCNKTKTARTAGRRSSPSPSRRHDQRLLRSKTTFVRIACTSCLPLNLVVVGYLRAFSWEEDQGHYK